MLFEAIILRVDIRFLGLQLSSVFNLHSLKLRIIFYILVYVYSFNVIYFKVSSWLILRNNRSNSEIIFDLSLYIFLLYFLSVKVIKKTQYF